MVEPGVQPAQQSIWLRAHGRMRSTAPLTLHQVCLRSPKLIPWHGIHTDCCVCSVLRLMLRILRFCTRLYCRRAETVASCPSLPPSTIRCECHVLCSLSPSPFVLLSVLHSLDCVPSAGFMHHSEQMSGCCTIVAPAVWSTPEASTLDGCTIAKAFWLYPRLRKG
jgi:hypothetical protein